MEPITVSLRLQRGDLLLASVSLVDPNFQGTVVLICEHDEEHGTYGLVLNRTIEVTDELREEVPLLGDTAYVGGPVQQEVLQVLHSAGKAIPGARPVLPGVWIGGDFEQIRRLLRSGEARPDQFRFFLGYSGWGKGQLAEEFSSGSWLKTRGSAALVFHTPVDDLWTVAVRAQGREDPVLTHFPKDPRWN